MKPLVTMRHALADPALLAGAMPGDSWFAWRTLLIAIMGEALVSEAEREAFGKLTGGRQPQEGSIVETFLAVAGRRSGKTRAMAVLVVYLATLCDWSDCLSLGERGVALFLAPSERQAAVVFRYAVAIVDHSPLLSGLVEGRTDGTLSLSRGVDLEVQAANWRRSRGFTAIAVVLDECAFFASGEESANPDTELLVALRPSLATTGGPMLLTSSPSTMQGITFTLHRRHYGPDGDPQVVVVQADSRTLNPSLSERVVRRAYDDDPEAAGAEYGGHFRKAQSAYLDRPLIERAVRQGAVADGPLPGVTYRAFVDVAGGTGTDSFTAAIGHLQRHEGRDIAICDVVFEQRPPFDPDLTTERAAALLKEWGVTWVKADRYAAAWPVSAFGRHGIGYQHAGLDASALYMHAVPLFTAGRVELPASPRLVDQLACLRRVVGSGGRESVQHPRGAHDDLANAVAGLLWMLSPARMRVPTVGPIIFSTAPAGPHLGSAADGFAEVGGTTHRQSFDYPGIGR